MQEGQIGSDPLSWAAIGMENRSYGYPVRFWSHLMKFIAGLPYRFENLGNARKTASPMQWTVQLCFPGTSAPSKAPSVLWSLFGPSCFSKLSNWRYFTGNVLVLAPVLDWPWFSFPDCPTAKDDDGRVADEYEIRTCCSKKLCWRGKLLFISFVAERAFNSRRVFCNCPTEIWKMLWGWPMTT